MMNQDLIDFMNGSNNNKTTTKEKNKTKKKVEVVTTKDAKNYRNKKEGDDYEKEEEKDGNCEYDRHDNDDDDVNAIPSTGSPIAVSNEAVAQLSCSNEVRRHTNTTTTITTTTRNQMMKMMNAYQQIILDWITMDDEQIFPIVQSILHIRQRMYHTQQYLHLSVLQQDNDNTDHHESVSTLSSWKRHGYRSRHCNSSSSSNDDASMLLLNQQDVQISIDYSLQHHERMIVELRHLLSNLGQLTNALSRRYEDVYQSWNNNNYEYGTISTATSNNREMMLLSIDDCQTLYIALAKELHRKQILVTKIIRSSSLDPMFRSNDSRIGVNDTTTLRDQIGIQHQQQPDDDNEQHAPIKIVQQCIREWSYRSEYSSIQNSQQQQQIQDVIASMMKISIQQQHSRAKK